MRRGTVLTRMVAVVLAACAAVAGGVVVSPAQQGEPVIIGGTLGLTGAFAGPSAEYKAVYDYWLRDVNSRGGLLGRPVRMVIYNDESTPTTAQALYQRLINEDHAMLLLAPYTTFVGGAVVPIVLAHHMVLFNGGFVGIKIFQSAGGWMVGSYTYQEPDYSRGVFELIDSLPPARRPRRVGILTEQNPFTIVVRDGYNGQGGVVGFAAQRHMPVVFSEEYPPSTTDFSGLIQKAKAANVDLFFALSLPNPAFLIARTASQQGFRPAIYCACGSQVTTLPAWPRLGAAGNGVMATTIAWPSDHFPGLDRLVSFFRGRGYIDIPTYATVSYSILQILEQAVTGARTLDQEKLREYLLSHEFQTANGPVRFHPDGTPLYSALLVQFLRGHNVVIWPPRRATGTPVIPMP